MSLLIPSFIHQFLFINLQTFGKEFDIIITNIYNHLYDIQNVKYYYHFYLKNPNIFNGFIIINIYTLSLFKKTSHH